MNTAISNGDAKTANIYLQAISEEDLTQWRWTNLLSLKMQPRTMGNFDSAVEAWEATAKGDIDQVSVKQIIVRNYYWLQKKSQPTGSVQDLEDCSLIGVETLNLMFKES